MKSTPTRLLFSSVLKFPIAISATLFSLGIGATAALAQSAPIYNPVQLPESDEITDTLTDKDIPTGFGGFARDYTITLESGDYLVVDLVSDEFDTIITMLAPDGSTYGENDDGPDGTTNSMLFARISEGGQYILRVTPYAGQGSGEFNLKVTRLRPI